MANNTIRNARNCFCFAGYDYCDNDVSCYCKEDGEQNKNTKED